MLSLVGILLIFAVTVGAAGSVSWVLKRLGWLPEDPAEAWGVSALVGLGLIGFLAFWAFPPRLCYLACLVAVPGLWVAFKTLRFSGSDRRGWVLGVPFLIGLVAALAPPDSLEWDTLAYHFAVPKLWLESGAKDFIPFIHHSNFPFAVDSLFMIGLSLGLESFAKGVTLCGWVAGAVAIFGFMRSRFGLDRAWWATFLYAGVPVVLWQAGTGYIDGVHGLFVGLGLVYGVEGLLNQDKSKSSIQFLGLAGTLLGLGAASKFTGILAILVLLAIGAGYALATKHTKLFKPLAVCACIAFLLPAPWFARNIKNTGNPVYPFLYEQLGGSNWDQWRTDVYKNEQQTFGVGRTEKGRDLTKIPHAVLGLAYQPGRYINPSPTQGTGFPMGAVGAACLFSACLGFLFYGRDKRVSLWVLSVSLYLGTWFFLSQQARYMTGPVVILAMLGALTISQKSIGQAIKVLIGAQLAYTIGLLYYAVTQNQLPAALGRIDRQTYLTERVSLAKNVPVIEKEVTKKGKVVLFDEVFGYLLNVPYVWGNPGHGQLLPHESSKSGKEFAEGLKKLGMTHVYINISIQSKEERERFLGALSSQPYSEEDAKIMMENLDLKWKWLIADGVQSGALVPTADQPRGAVLLRIK